MEFFKMEGSGNDFVVMDNRSLALKARKKTAVRLCDRKFGIGADGLLLLEKSEKADFRMRIFNSDGSEAEMCGNGLRCILRFAVETGIARRQPLLVETGAGILRGTAEGKTSRAQINVTGKPRMNVKIRTEGKTFTGHFMNTGVPHLVIITDEIDTAPVETMGPKIRYHRLFRPKGTNVDWIEAVNDRLVKIRTYERGVEGETLSCGTGSVAGALTAFLIGLARPPVTVMARSGEKLKIHFDSRFSRVYLEGDTSIVFKGAWLGS